MNDTNLLPNGVPVRDARFAILGAGPVGTVLAAHLAQVTDKIAIVDRDPDVRQALTENGAQIVGVKALTGRVSRVAERLQDLNGFDPDVLIIATKTWAFPMILPGISSAHRPNRIYLVAQNGMDNERIIADRFGADRTIRAVLNFGAGPLAPGVQKMAFFHPPNLLGGGPDIRPFAEGLAAFLTAGGFPTDYSGDLRRHIWKKVAMNASVGAMCALTRRDMGGIIGCEGTRIFLRRLLRECAAVANAEGCNFDEDFVQSCVEYTQSAGRHRPSMLQDVEAGRPTEVDTLNWRIVELGRKYGIPTPYHETLAVMVHGIEAGAGVCAGFRTGSPFRSEEGHVVCGTCPYDHGHTAVRGTSIVGVGSGGREPAG